MLESIKKHAFDVVNDRDDDGIPNHIFDYIIITLIILNIFAIFLETYKPIYSEYRDFFIWFEYFSVIVFTVEYIIRIWTCTYYDEYTTPVIGRFRYAVSLMMIIDFFAVFPFYLSLLLPLDPRIVKLFRMFRLFRIFKLLRYYKSFEVVLTVLKKNKDYLISVLIILIGFLIFVSYTIFIIESEAQPDKFQDFDDSFWWSVITLTTVGYGDTYPITDIGRFLTVIVLLIGIGLISLPTGIIASGFLEEVRKRKECSMLLSDNSIADEIRKLYQLNEDGIISEDEYQRIKEKLLSK